MKPNKEEARAAFEAHIKEYCTSINYDEFAHIFQTGRKITPAMIERGHEAIAGICGNPDGDYIEQAEACLKAALGSNETKLGDGDEQD